ncbi:hypothetical protein [Telluribacter sp.]|jgi:hypothetical protein|uniref:hypothetical protein n=1 Tax=Telluribacter sp. TaxID=1978767 RepID=UPI002E0D1A10|nr:hypothetical protein [Telluribacter sp.]
MDFLEKLTKDDILHGQFPLLEILDNSFYYPACGLDGRVVKWYARHIQSFIYCDYAISKERFLLEMENFMGYTVFGHRSVQQQELVPNGWYPVLPRGAGNFRKYEHVWEKPFCHWVVYERNAELGEEHGPKRFSLLFICGEGVATYQALYHTNRTSAKAVAIIRPGTGFGFNWTNFYEAEKPLYQVMMENPYGRPDLVLASTANLRWPMYSYYDVIRTHDRFTGNVTLWKSQHQEEYHLD